MWQAWQGTRLITDQLITNQHAGKPSPAKQSTPHQSLPANEQALHLRAAGLGKTPGRLWAGAAGRQPMQAASWQPAQRAQQR